TTENLQPVLSNIPSAIIALPGSPPLSAPDQLTVNSCEKPKYGCSEPSKPNFQVPSWRMRYVPGTAVLGMVHCTVFREQAKCWPSGLSSSTTPVCKVIWQQLESRGVGPAAAARLSRSATASLSISCCTAASCHGPKWVEAPS